jgi:multicomponent Na+:H+ antiporter subunit D
VIVAVAIVGSMLTFLSMTKIWIGLFWGEVRPEPPADRIGIMRHHKVMSAASILLVASTLGIAAMAGPLYDFSVGAAEQLMDPMMYINAVRGS